jgi:hypothetical protein
MQAVRITSRTQTDENHRKCWNKRKDKEANKKPLCRQIFAAGLKEKAACQAICPKKLIAGIFLPALFCQTFSTGDHFDSSSSGENLPTYPQFFFHRQIHQSFSS